MKRSWIAVALAIACATEPSPPVLRVRNVGTTDLVALRVTFPETSIAFGDVAAGRRTQYRAVAGGVYAYAAYRFVYQGSEVVQLVDDWVGEEPLRGRIFTYDVRLRLNSRGQPFIAATVWADDAPFDR